MTLIKSISGIRGTIGGEPGEGLTPIDIVKFSSAFAKWLAEKNISGKKLKIVVGRDARMSGQMVNQLVVGTLIGMGVDVVDLGLSTTPTVEVAVPEENANGGIILTASHNPAQWNALKLLNEKGEFISGNDGERLLEIAEEGNFSFAEINEIGSYTEDDSYMHKHINMIKNLDLVDTDIIRACQFKVVCDCVNSSGGVFVPSLLHELGVKEVIELYCEPTGDFPHNPEPLPENLTEISKKVVETGADFGIVVDPDVDRLAIVCEDGTMFGEEYTLVAIADYVLQNTPGNTVSNMSSTRALRDVTEGYGCEYHASAVGEVNVVQLMKQTNAVIGGEGNGGVIYPELHYGRDALVGIALFLSHLGKSGVAVSHMKNSFPAYTISKNKIELTPEINVDHILEKMVNKYEGNPINTLDGVKIELGKEWVHMRKSNTEPIIRIYSESENFDKANALGERFVNEIRGMV